jgi:hypothetical protein
MLDIARAQQHIDQQWGDEIVPALVEYIKIPNKSPAFDPDWAAHGYMDAAVSLFEGWARRKLPALPGATLEIVRLPGRTPLILIEVPGDGRDTALLYGHLDKQPEMVGWARGRRTPAASSSSRRARNPAATICRIMWTIWRPGWARRRWWCASIRAAAITISCG